MGRPTYVTREAVKSALGSKLTARDDDQVDDARFAATDTVDALLHVAHVDPRIDTRSFDWPNDQLARTWRLWLGDDTLIALTSATSGGVALTGLIPYPLNAGPPYTWVETDLEGAGSFGQGTGTQGNIDLLGLFGLTDESAPAGAAAEALDISEPDVSVSDSSGIGVGTLLRAENERMIVEARSLLTTGQTLGTNLAADDTADVVNLSLGTAFHVGERLTIDSERMDLVDIAGNNGIVRRAVDGSRLAAHTSGATIYAPRLLTVERAANGTTAATHADQTALTRWVVPRLVWSLSLAEAISQVENEQAGYARTVGEGESQREAAGKTLDKMRAQCFARWGRMRTAAV